MSSKSNDQGRAYEYICLTSLYEAIKPIRKAKIINNSSYIAALRAWNTLDANKQSLYSLSAKSTIETIFALEPRIIEKKDDVLNLFIQTDTHGKEGDVRDIIIERKDIVWEIGLSIKHNHEAVKHSRLSKKLDFGDKWYGHKCSNDYWNAVKPTFDYLQAERKKKTKFEDIDIRKLVYIPLLTAFKDEIVRHISEDPTIAQKMVKYLLSKYDFYKVISVDKLRITTIQSFNMYGTLNLPSKSAKPSIIVPVINLPTQMIHIGLKPNSETTLLMCFDNGWQFSFRIHNAEKVVCASLKFDVQIEGMPPEINIKYNCKWD